MESVGERLRRAREEMGVSIEQVARETLISKRYLFAIESEEFSVMPGETYISGFISNYSTYLGLDPIEMVTLYKNFQIQEQPIPFNELLESHRKPSLKILLIIMIELVFGVTVFAGLFYFSPLKNRSSQSVELAEINDEADVLELVPIPLSQEVLVRWFQIGQEFDVPLGDQVVRLRIVEYEENLAIAYLGKVLGLRVGEEQLVDLNQDTIPDIRFLLNDIGKDNDLQIANLGLYRLIRPRILQESDTSTQIMDEVSLNTVEQSLEFNDGERGQAPVRSFQSPVVLIKESERKVSFVLNLKFRGNCLFRYSTDSKEIIERFYRNGEEVKFDVSRTVTMWFSNAGTVVLKIDSTELQLGEDGSTAVKLLEWQKTEDEQLYLLKMYTIY